MSVAKSAPTARALIYARRIRQVKHDARRGNAICPGETHPTGLFVVHSFPGLVYSGLNVVRPRMRLWAQSDSDELLCNLILIGNGGGGFCIERKTYTSSVENISPDVGDGCYQFDDDSTFKFT